LKRRAVILAAGLFLVLTVLAFLGQTAGTGIRTRYPSSLAGEAEGVLAFRRLLLELEQPVRTLGTGWDGPELNGPGLLIVAAPLQRGIRGEEISGLSSWVRSGGSLLVIEDSTVLERSPELETFLEDAGLISMVPVSDLNPATLKPKRPDRFPSAGGADLPAGLEIRRVQLNRGAEIAAEEPVRTLLQSDNGYTTAAEIDFGDGVIVLVLGPLLANDRLLEGDTLDLALWLVDDLRGEGPIWFDEYHHGHGGLLATLGSLNRAALGWAALQAALASLIYALTRGIRFGPPRTVPDPPRRSNLEFVHSMASMYRRASAGRYALGMILTRLRRETGWLTGSPDSATAEELAAALSKRYRLARGATTATVRAAEHATKQNRLSDRELLTLASELAVLQQEITGEHRESD
jgi:hypothetical protein